MAKDKSASVKKNERARGQASLAANESTKTSADHVSDSLGQGFGESSRSQHTELLNNSKISSSDKQSIARSIQAAYGNRYTMSLLSNDSGPGSTPIQTKMAVGPAGDKSEREADHVAKRVLSELKGGGEPPVQRQEIEGETGSLLQLKPLQRQIGMEGGDVSGDIESSINRSRGSGKPIDRNVRAPMENAFGANFSDVSIHTGAESTALNDSMSARAFTTGNDIFFRQGEYNPGSDAGKEVLAHELTHVVQQTNPSSVNRSPQVIQRDDTPEEKAARRDKDLKADAQMAGETTLSVTGTAVEGLGGAVAEVASLGLAAAVGQTASGLGAMYKSGKEGDAGGVLEGAANTAAGASLATLQGIALNLGEAAARTSGAASAAPVTALVLGVVQIGLGTKGIIEAIEGYTELNQLVERLRANHLDDKTIAAALLAADVNLTQAKGSAEQVATGILNVAGASVLLAVGLSNPVGWAILTAAGGIAVGAWAYGHYKKRAKGQAIVKKAREKYDDELKNWKEGDAKPVLDPMYDPNGECFSSTIPGKKNPAWSGRTWLYGYSGVFKAEQAKAADEAADAIYALTRHEDDNKRNIGDQICTSMNVTVDEGPVRENPKKAAIAKHLKATL